MYSECVPKRMWDDGFREAGQPMRLLAGCFYGVLRDWPIIVNAREQPLLRANGDPVAAQDLQQHGRQHHVPIFATFTRLRRCEPTLEQWLCSARRSPAEVS